MAKVDQYAQMMSYLKQLKAVKVKNPNFATFGAIVEKLGPANYHKDAQLVAAADEKELDSVFTGFVADELKIEDKVKGMKMIKAIALKMKPIKRKYRAVFYYLLSEKAKDASK